MPGDTAEETEGVKIKIESSVEQGTGKSPSPVHQDEEIARASPGRSSSPGNGSRSHAPPIITNSVPNRPPSTTSVHSSGSAGPRSTTATSRRGGRTRSRSPPMMTSRPASTGPGPEPFAGVDDRRAPTSPANPSAAAAAAAAAAKSISRNPPPPPMQSTWYDSPEGREREYRRSRGGEPVRYHPRYYEGDVPPPRHHWPEEHVGRPPSRNRYPPARRPVEQDHYGYQEGYSSYRGRSSRGEPPYPPPYDDDYDRRYPDPRYERPRSTSPMPPAGYEYRGRDHLHHRPEDPYYSGRNDPEDVRADSRASASVKRTTRVIGTPTPIHMPRAADPSIMRGSKNGSQSDSIFRGRPVADSRPPVEDSTQKVLMSLRTPSNSFEEKGSKDSGKLTGHSLSPEAPPQIQHSHYQNSSDANLFFEPQRSPKGSVGPPQPSSSIDMAPSFTLFNQSFDSIGDTANFFNVSGPLDSALQSTSFGVGPSASDDKVTELHLTSSAGNFSQQLLVGSTFEMSPNNSFGNGPPVMRSRSGNMLVLGGQDNRVASPSQVLDMYSRSYSGGGPIASPRAKKSGVEDGHLRISGGPPGPGMSSSYGHDIPLNYRSTGFGHPESVDGDPGFYIFLKRHKMAFKECSFLLPGLKAALLQTPNVKEEAAADTPKRHTRSDYYGEPSLQDISIAQRRVTSAVCAFGGTFQGDRPSQQQKSNGAQSIFREKPGDSATVTPNSSASTSPGTHRSRQRAKYDEMLPSRYYENDNRLSWEFEESPPIDDMGREEEEADELKREEGRNEDGNDMDGDDEKKDGDGDNGNEDGKKTPSGSKDGDQPKMRYRCKLCGQPKQNHTCPYQQSLARSIGTMIYPAINSFTAAEPGSLAPALSEMNNFISGSDSVSSNEGSPSRPTPDRIRHMNKGGPPGTAQVTPESMRGNTRGLGSPVTTPQRARTPGPRTRPAFDMQRRFMGGTPPPGSPRGRKRGHMHISGIDDQADLLFVEAIDLKPEQFRIVTASKIVSSPDAFTYPALPLPYAQRKRLSDNLFSLSKEVPQLTDECATVLREAREKDQWDLAVAELMTQVVVVVHCHTGDSRFEGLRRYLMSLGIAC